jgi:hypothetical protein
MLYFVKIGIEHKLSLAGKWGQYIG